MDKVFLYPYLSKKEKKVFLYPIFLMHKAIYIYYYNKSYNCSTCMFRG